LILLKIKYPKKGYKYFSKEKAHTHIQKNIKSDENNQNKDIITSNITKKLKLINETLMVIYNKKQKNN